MNILGVISGIIVGSASGIIANKVTEKVCDKCGITGRNKQIATAGAAALVGGGMYYATASVVTNMTDKASSQVEESDEDVLVRKMTDKASSQVETDDDAPADNAEDDDVEENDAHADTADTTFLLYEQRQELNDDILQTVFDKIIACENAIRLNNADEIYMCVSELKYYTMITGQFIGIKSNDLNSLSAASNDASMTSIIAQQIAKTDDDDAIEELKARYNEHLKNIVSHVNEFREKVIYSKAN